MAKALPVLSKSATGQEEHAGVAWEGSAVCRKGRRCKRGRKEALSSVQKVHAVIVLATS